MLPDLMASMAGPAVGATDIETLAAMVAAALTSGLVIVHDLMGDGQAAASHLASSVLPAPQRGQEQ